MTRPVQNFFALFWLSLPGLLLAAPDNASQPTSSSHDPGEPSSAPESVVRRLKTVAEVFGASDSISTYLAMQNGSVHERNRLISTSPANLVGLAATKILMLELFDAKLSNSEKKVLFPVASALYASASANNLLLAAAASNPIAIVGGIAAGLYTHQAQTAYARDSLKLYCSGGNRLRDCTRDYSPQYVVHLR